MTEEGLHLDVAGAGEIVTAPAGGADQARLVLHGNAKTDDEISLAVRSGLGLIVVDNFDDVDRLGLQLVGQRRSGWAARRWFTTAPGASRWFSARKAGHAWSQCRDTWDYLLSRDMAAQN